jgi:multidrug efflux system membrane fusion protein
LAFKVPGTVERLYRVTTPEGERDVQEGDLLHAGDVIAELDPQDYIRQRDRAQAELAGTAETIRRAQAARQFAERELTRLDGLRQDGSVSTKEIDDARSQFEMADAELQAAIQARAAAEKVYEQAQANVQDCELRVPIDRATVVQKRVEPEERVQAGQPIFRVMDISTVHVEFGVPDTLLGTFVEGEGDSRVSMGQALQISLDAFAGQTFTGQVSKIAPAADPTTRTFLVQVTLDNPEHVIKPGMIATVSLGEQREAVLLPMTAVQPGTQPGQTIAYLIEEAAGRALARSRPIELGGVYNNQIEILLGSSDVQLGDRVVVTGASRLHDGAVVRVVPEDS